MGLVFIIVGSIIALESNSTAPGIYVGAAVAIAGLLATAIEEAVKS
jgi:hypothetical protein